MRQILNLLHFHNSLFLAIFLISSSSAYELGASPTELYFEGNIGQQVCKNFKIFSSQPTDIFITDRWNSNFYSKKNFFIQGENSNEYGLKLRYPSVNYVYFEDNIKICITSKIEGAYAGLLLLSDSSDRASIGIWLTVLSLDENISVNSITGYSIFSSINEQNLLFFNMILMFILLTILLFFLRRFNQV